MRLLRRTVASLSVLFLPKAVCAAEAKSRAVLPVLTLPPIGQAPLPSFSAIAAARKELRWLGLLSFGPRKDTGVRILQAPSYEDRHMNCGKYCLPTFEMDRTSAAARGILFGVGAVSVGMGAAIALAPTGKDGRFFAPSFRFCIGTQKLATTAVWSF
jgi:hypothetical protein